MNQENFELLLDSVANKLTSEMRINSESEYFSDALEYEQRVRELLHEVMESHKEFGQKNPVSLDSSGQTFPDIPCGEYGVEVKFTKSDTWTSVANSIRESNRVEGVKVVYLMFGKMGGIPESRWKRYEDCIVHVRTSHEPRFQVDMTGSKEPLFKIMGIEYDAFRKLDIMDKMPYIRKYARSIHPDGRLWWLEDTVTGDEHSTPVDLILYTSLDDDTKLKYRAEATLLCPRVLNNRRDKAKYNDAVMFMLSYHGVLCHQARDLFSAGSAAKMNKSDGKGIPYVQRATTLLGPYIEEAAYSLDPALFAEYWGINLAPDKRLAWWLEKANEYAGNWTKKPSELMFLEYQKEHGLRPDDVTSLMILLDD